MENAVEAEVVIDFLNSLLKIDKKAISSLFKFRVSCNEEMINHPTVQTCITGDGSGYVGLLGILNGLVGSKDGLPLIFAKVDFENNDSIEEFIHLKDKPANK